jgi:hypothetical protein
MSDFGPNLKSGGVWYWISYFLLLLLFVVVVVCDVSKLSKFF